MECIFCNGESRITNTVKEDGTVYRKRICLECKKEFFTYEIDITDEKLMRMCKKALSTRYNKRRR